MNVMQIMSVGFVKGFGTIAWKWRSYFASLRAYLQDYNIQKISKLYFTFPSAKDSIKEMWISVLGYIIIMINSFRRKRGLNLSFEGFLCLRCRWCSEINVRARFVYSGILCGDHRRNQGLSGGSFSICWGFGDLGIR